MTQYPDKALYDAMRDVVAILRKTAEENNITSFPDQVAFVQTFTLQLLAKNIEGASLGGIPPEGMIEMSIEAIQSFKIKETEH